MNTRHILRTCLFAVAASALFLPNAVFAAVPAAEKDEPVQPIPNAKATSPAKVELGKKLFFEPRLSKSGFISCNSCHNLSRGGSDNLTSSIGDRWQQGPINSPTVLNSGHHFVQFWDGRAKDLKEQAGGPIANPKEIASTHELAINVLNSIPQYQDEFAKIYGKKPIDIDQVTDAIAEFEETLVTPNSRFDKWLKGDRNAITEAEYKGYQLFKDSGCTACHSGPILSSDSFQKLGLVTDYKTENPAKGRFDVTGDAADRFMFKVPTLRNVELTEPYFHDGAAATLEEAVTIMGKIQLDRAFAADEAANIVAFLKSLTGDQPQIMLPILPPSNNNTPRPAPFN